MAMFTNEYRDVFGYQVSDARGQNQVLTQWSSEVLRLGMDQLVFSRFLSIAPPGIAMGKGRGDTYRIPIFNWVESTAGTTPLSPGTAIPLLSQGTLNVYGTLDEFGRGIAMENTLDYYTKINNASELLETVANNRARVINELCRSVIDTTPHLVSLRSSVTFNVASNAGVGSAMATLNSTAIKQIRDWAKKQRVPTFANGLYVYVGNAQHLRGLKDEGVFEQYNYYNNPGFSNGLIYQVLGNWYGVTFIETEEGMAGSYGYFLAPEIGVSVYAKPISLYYYPDINSDADRMNVLKWHMIAGYSQTLRNYGTRAFKVFATMF